MRNSLIIFISVQINQSPINASFWSRCVTAAAARRTRRRKSIFLQFIQRLRRGLRGLSYLGMIEPAYYVNVCQGTHVHGKRTVSWHLHLLAWGEFLPGR